MNSIVKGLGWALVLAALAAGCGAAPGPSPQAWIDQPLDNSRFAEGPLTIWAHASDADGVAGFDFLVDGETIASVESNGERLGEAIIEWTPPGPGTYTINVHAQDTQGNVGQDAQALIEVGDLPLVAATSTVPTPEVAQADEGDVAPEITLPVPPPGPTITALQASNCRAGTSTQFDSIGFFEEGEQAPIQGQDASGQWLLVTAPDTGKACWIAAYLGDLQGDLSIVQVVATPPPPVASGQDQSGGGGGASSGGGGGGQPSGPDTTAPDIQSASVSPNSVYAQGASCTPHKATVTVVATDDGGIAGGTVFWNLSGDSGDAPMVSVGGNTYQGEVGPVSKAGTLTLFVDMEDNAGNDALSGTLQVTVVANCIN